MRKIFLLALLPLAFGGCNGINPIKDKFSKTPPYKKYIRSLQQAELEETALAQAWINAGENVFTDSIFVDLPFSESGYFEASRPSARSYRFKAAGGQVLTVNTSVISKENSKMFVDLFSFGSAEWVPLANSDSTANLTFEFEKDYQDCVLRIQPELLVTAYYTISISLTPVLMNPVAGATNKSIGSFYGDSRDGGKRRHEGVDIFAKKGTPVVAPLDGYVSRVGTSNLGGKVVWMQDDKRRHAYYFAHLDEQLVVPGIKVRRGDTLGTVGNTGNARYTPPHLHFGIYQGKSKDPINFIKTLDAVTEALPWDTTFRQPEFKTIAKSSVLFSGPAKKHTQRTTLSKGSYVEVVAQSGEWFRVMLPDTQEGFMQRDQVAAVKNGRKSRLKAPSVLYAGINNPKIPLMELHASTMIEVLATFEDFRFVRTKDGTVGWLSM